MPDNLKEKKQNQCSVCKNKYSPKQTVPLATIRDSLLKYVFKSTPDADIENGYICLNDLNKA
ncbi:MAG: hypothetical protein H7281_07955 [Bacteriovorax sp.]|nr:hypothetical protein [Bacteriovorax sp.]